MRMIIHIEFIEQQMDRYTRFEKGDNVAVGALTGMALDSFKYWPFFIFPIFPLMWW